MKVAWIYPHRGRCGIAQYSLDYIDALSGSARIVEIDPQWWFTDRKQLADSLRGCSLVHVQYDTAAFMKGRSDGYRATVSLLRMPVIVSLHEVYDEDPWAFPRSAIRGPFPAAVMKRLLWDLRHPVQRAFSRHLRGSFFARRILVHHRYHCDILRRAGVDGNRLRVLPMPVKRFVPFAPFPFPHLPLVRLGFAGFVNRSCDFDLLFGTLGLLKRPWTFTWIGGLRENNERTSMDALMKRISEMAWGDRFSVTGWVTGEEMSERLGEIDIVLAFFTRRSSSASIARAMGACKPVIAVGLPLVAEIASYHQPCGAEEPPGPPLLPVPADPAAAAGAVERLIDDQGLRENLYDGLASYTDAVSFERSAGELFSMYRSVAQP